MYGGNRSTYPAWLTYGFPLYGALLLGFFLLYRLQAKLGFEVPIILPLSLVIITLFWQGYHSYLMLGKVKSLLFLTWAWGFSYLAEYIGQRSGHIFGSYQYTGELGPLLPGNVPLAVPTFWYAMTYSIFCIMKVFLNSRELNLYGKVLFVLSGSWLMTAWDLVLDPVVVALGGWKWLDSGAYFGIPVQNYVGWWVISVIIFCIYIVFDTYIPWEPAFKRWDIFALFPCFGYFLIFLNNSIACFQRGYPACGVVGLLFWTPVVVMFGLKIKYRILNKSA